MKYLQLILILCLLSQFAIANGLEQKTIIIDPVSDSYVRDKSPITNYGSKTNLIAYNWIVEEEQKYVANSYIMYYLADIDSKARIDSANLKIFVSDLDAEIDGFVYFCPDSSWSELVIDWKNAPPYEVTYSSSIKIKEKDKFYSFDVSEIISHALDKNLTKVTLVIKAKEKDTLSGFSFESKESVLKDKIPRLEIAFSIGEDFEKTIPPKNGIADKNTTQPTNIPKSTETVKPPEPKNNSITEIPIEKTTIPINQKNNGSNKPESSLTISKNLIIYSSLITITGLIAGFSMMYVIRPKMVQRKKLQKLRPKKEGKKSDELTDITICNKCNEKLRPLSFTNKSICPNCQKLYERSD